MPRHDYSPAQALRLLLGKLDETNGFLAGRIREAIDSGKDVFEEKPAIDRRRKNRYYRRRIAYTDQEALEVALNVISAHFYELPRIVNSTIDAFKKTSLGAIKRLINARAGETEWEYASAVSTALVGEFKPIEVEVETESTQTKEQRPNLKVVTFNADDIDNIRNQISRLRHLVDFTE